MGDLNGDGVLELAVTALFADPGGQVDAGSIYIYDGATGVEFQRFDGLGPLRFDGENPGDLLGGEPACHCGWISVIGDVNKDGYPDFMAGAVGATVNGETYAGRVLIFSGYDASVLLGIDNPDPNNTPHFFGVSGARLGDLDGNGTIEFVIGAGDPIADWLVPIEIGSAYLFSIPMDIPITQDPNEQLGPAAASDGNNYLLVWKDLRNDPSCADPFDELSNCNWDIYGTRIDTAGNILDPNGIPITTGLGHQRIPVVRYGGGVYLAVWQEVGGTQGEVRGARITQNGQVLDTGGFSIGVGSLECSFGITFDGNNFMVFWTDPTAGVIRGSRVSLSGQVLDPGGFQVSYNTGAGWPSAAFGAGVNLVVWDTNTGDIHGAIVSPSGQVLNGADLIISSLPDQEGISSSYSVDFDGTNFLATWGIFNAQGFGVRGALVSPTGTVISPAPIVISDGSLEWDVASSKFNT